MFEHGVKCWSIAFLDLTAINVNNIYYLKFSRNLILNPVSSCYCSHPLQDLTTDVYQLVCCLKSAVQEIVDSQRFFHCFFYVLYYRTSSSSTLTSSKEFKWKSLSSRSLCVWIYYVCDLNRYFLLTNYHFNSLIIYLQHFCDNFSVSIEHLILIICSLVILLWIVLHLFTFIIGKNRIWLIGLILWNFDVIASRKYG